MRRSGAAEEVSPGGIGVPGQSGFSSNLPPVRALAFEKPIEMELDVPFACGTRTAMERIHRAPSSAA